MVDWLKVYFEQKHNAIQWQREQEADNKVIDSVIQKREDLLNPTPSLSINI